MKTSLARVQGRANVFVAALLAAFCALSGCLSKPPLKKQTFTFAAPATAPANAGAGGRVLGIRHLRIAPPFDGRSLVYRTGDFSYVRDPYAEFLAPPEEEMLAPVRGWLRGDDTFSAVVESDSALKPNTLVEINVTRLFGDFRQSKSPAAVFTMRCVFFDARNGVPEKVLLQQEYSRTIPLKAPSAAALVDGWNRALGEMLAQAASDLRRIRALDQASR